MRQTADLAYGEDPLQVLDLYRPDTDEPVPVVLYLHGGGWQVGDKRADAKERLERLATYGIAVASANYRLVPGATYPAQVHDAKRAVAWLREHGGELGLTTRRIGIWGASAGGYLATMLGVTNDDAALADGLDPKQCRVDAVVDWFGQSDLRSNSTRSWLEKEVLNPPFEQAFLGLDDPAQDIELVRGASPLLRIGAGAPPFLIVHGDRDRITPISESVALHDALVRAGAESTFVTLGGAGHESHTFDRPDHLAMTAAFLLQHLTVGA
jgi:acetyl esterase/lipase